MIPLLKRKQGNQGSVWCMLRRDRVPRGVRRSAGPVLHTPIHTGERKKPNQAYIVCFMCLVWSVDILERIEWMKVLSYILWGIIIFDYIMIFFIPPLLSLCIFLVFWEPFIPEICGKYFFCISLGWKQNNGFCMEWAEGLHGRQPILISQEAYKEYMQHLTHRKRFCMKEKYL